MSSFRAIKKNIVKKVIDYKEPYVFIDGLILKNTRNISIIPIEHNKRPIGQSNYSFAKLWSLWANISTTFPFSPLRIATVFRIILFVIIFFIRKLLILLKKDKRIQYEIDETTFEKK
jgi:undecaprenyl-phosphate 4-deoxy-4-formamido-L-arabinose transferase